MNKIKQYPDTDLIDCSPFRLLVRGRKSAQIDLNPGIGQSRRRWMSDDDCKAWRRGEWIPGFTGMAEYGDLTLRPIVILLDSDSD